MRKTKTLFIYMLTCSVLFSFASLGFTQEDSQKKNEKPKQAYELPLEGATGFASIALDVYSGLKNNSIILKTFQPGEAFKILKQYNKWLHIVFINEEGEEQKGFVRQLFTMVNMPDIIPSIIYNNANATSSVFRSSGFPLPNITGKKLYDGKSYNQRFQREVFVMPVLLPVALKIQKAQKLAMADGNSLLIYESFRPYSAQREITKNLTELMGKNTKVRKGITTAPWSVGWFISKGISNHQRGFALDLTLAKVLESKKATMGEHSYTYPIKYEEYKMPSPMHELSSASIALSRPISSISVPNGWKTVPRAESMNESALLLQYYCTKVGLTPIASEWWHFDDLDTRSYLGTSKSDGKYFLAPIVSNIPIKEEKEKGFFDKVKGFFS